MTSDTKAFLRSLPDGTRLNHCRIASKVKFSSGIGKDEIGEATKMIMEIAKDMADQIRHDPRLTDELARLEGETGNKFVIVILTEEHEYDAQCPDCVARAGS